MNNKQNKPAYSGIISPQIFSLFALAMILNSGSAIAAPETINSGKSPVAIKLSLKKVAIDASGNETLVEAPKIKPGDVVEYRAVYRNQGKQQIKDLNALLPIPFGLEYIDNSARPAKSARATADNAKFEPIPLKRIVKDRNGKEQMENVPFAEYRGLRWTVGVLDAGKKTEISARMHVVELPKGPEDLVKKPASAANVLVQPVKQ